MLLFPNLLLLFLSAYLICAVESAPLQTNDTNGQNLTQPQEPSQHAVTPSKHEQALNPKGSSLTSLQKTLASLLSNPNTSQAAIETVVYVLGASRKQSPSSQGLGRPSPTPADKPTTQSPPTGSGEKILRVGESMHAPELPTSSLANE